MKSVAYTDILIAFGIFAVLALISQYGQPGGVNITTGSNQKQNTMWIVVTSIQYPTENIKDLAAQPGWHVVVVADLKTPIDWNYTNVHFLSIKKQKEYFGEFADQLPYNSYTRKTLGYLYALVNGAEGIYDTDDDNKPFGLGLSQFDYSSSIAGLRYVSRPGSNISEKLFNPYRFYGLDKMWPRGFPLEYIESHTNGEDRMVTCRQMPRPAVQQGVVKADPDVDAIYRLLHAEKDEGLDVEFDSLAPPIVLESGTYSPWNSQNTLFHYKAFFIMFLPTTVAFRVTDIWRSYFGQKLLHLIGETVAFYPTNAIQIRNAHNYLNDFHQEIDVYEQSGKIVEFLNNWKCSHSDIVNCTLQLADGFVKNKFFGKQDRYLIGEWLKHLSHVGYIFPPLSKETSLYTTGSKYSLCRTANVDVGVNKYHEKKDKEHTWAEKTLDGFGEVLEWCKEATDDNNTFLPTAEQFLKRYRNMTGLQMQKDTVLVIMSNQPWRPAIVGLLQRMYSPFFKSTVFCGTWTDPTNETAPLPAIPPFNYVNITLEEMRNGAGYGYCVPKVKNLRLQNVTGYFFMADDAVFNIWLDLPLGKVLNPEAVIDNDFWWRPDAINRSYDAFEEYYKNDPRFGNTWRQYKQNLQRFYPNNNITEHYLTAKKKALSDFFYIPSHIMEYFGNLLEVLTETEVFSEVAFGKAMDGLDYNRVGIFTYLWGDRALYPQVTYNTSMLGFHPLKLTAAQTDLTYRKKYCNMIVKAFGEEIYGRIPPPSPPPPSSVPLVATRRPYRFYNGSLWNPHVRRAPFYKKFSQYRADTAKTMKY